jgi:hypothetical protein
MKPHELLRQAALILTDGWSHNTNARDDTGRIVPLFAGSGRSAINPAATKFSPYGAICKAASQSPKAQMTPAMWDVLQRLAREMGGRGQHPLTNLNEQEGVELTDLVTLLNRAADELDPAITAQEPRTAAQDARQLGAQEPLSLPHRNAALQKARI